MIYYACRLYAREIFATNDNPRVGFVVFKQNVVAWLERFDERILQQKGILFTINDNVLYVINLFYEYAHFGRMFFVL